MTAYRYVLTNITSIIEAEEHLGLSENVFRRILKHPALPCKGTKQSRYYALGLTFFSFFLLSEIDLYKAVLSWHKHHHGDFQTNREILMTHLSMLDLRLIDLKDIATFVHNSGVFSPFELSELYRLRISLQQSGTTRTNRKVTAPPNLVKLRSYLPNSLLWCSIRVRSTALALVMSFNRLQR